MLPASWTISWGTDGQTPLTIDELRNWNINMQCDGNRNGDENNVNDTDAGSTPGIPGKDSLIRST